MSQTEEMMDLLLALWNDQLKKQGWVEWPIGSYGGVEYDNPKLFIAWRTASVGEIRWEDSWRTVWWD